MPDIDAIRREIETRGLSVDADRLADARRNIDFYRGNFDAYWEPRKDKDGATILPKQPRPSLLMQWAVNTLGGLYATGPAREVADDKPATDWLVGLHEREGLDGLLQEADRLAIAADVSAVQVVATGDPARPLRFALWPAHQFAVWESEGDPTVPDAVATLDFWDNRRRLRVYTADVELTFRTDKAEGTAGGTAFRFVGAEDNPFGVLPFAFVHANPPTTCFWSHGPGDALQATNAYVNESLTSAGESIKYGLKPILKVCGAGSWTVPGSPQPGDVWYPPNGAYDEAGNGVPVQIDYLQPDPGFIEAEWADLQSGIDHALQAANLPPAAFRMVQTGAASGVAIVAEQLPVLKAIEARQRPFLSYERQLARVALAMGGLDPAKADALRLRWPEVVPRSLLFGPDEDKADQADLDLGITSRIQILMRRFNWTREQAVAHLKQLADDRKEEDAIDPPPPPPTATTQPAPTGQEANADAGDPQERTGARQGPGGTQGRAGDAG